MKSEPFREDCPEGGPEPLSQPSLPGLPWLSGFIIFYSSPLLLPSCCLPCDITALLPLNFQSLAQALRSWSAALAGPSVRGPTLPGAPADSDAPSSSWKLPLMLTTPKVPCRCLRWPKSLHCGHCTHPGVDYTHLEGQAHVLVCPHAE